MKMESDLQMKVMEKMKKASGGKKYVQILQDGKFSATNILWIFHCGIAGRQHRGGKKARGPCFSNAVILTVIWFESVVGRSRPKREGA